MAHTFLRSMWGSLVVLAMGCGGAGGGGASLQVTPASLSFTATKGGTAPAAQSLHVKKASGYDYGSGWATTQPAWLHEDSFSRIDTRQPEFDHVFSITTTDLDPGTYTGTYVVTLSEQGSGPTPVAAQQEITITYTVRSPP